MASFNRRLIYNTRERLLSTDLNDTTALLHAKSTDELVAFVTDNRFRGVNPASGVLSGGICGANGADLTISVSPILAFKLGNAATSFDSDYLKIETRASVQIDLSAFVDPGNPRWVAIEVAPGDAQEIVSSRDIFQPALGTFIPQNVDKVRQPEPIFTVNAGTPAAAPVLPLGNPDVLPLAYVYIPASAASIDPLDVILCRPIYRAIIQPEAWLQGRGGIDADGGNFVAQPRNFIYKPPVFPVQSVIAHPGINAQVAGDPNFAAGESFPAGPDDDAVFMYLATPPYPPGYDNDVIAREYIDASGRIPSVPFGTGFPFLANGVFVFSTASAPNPAGAKGTPTTPITAINDPTWNGGTIDSIAYVGSVVYDDASSQWKPQRSDRQDDGWIYFTARGNPDGVGQDSDTAVAATVNNIVANGRAINPLTPGSEIVLPQHVREIKVTLTGSAAGGTNFGEVVFEETGTGDANFGIFWRRRAGPDPAVGFYQETIEVFLDAAGFWDVSNAGVIDTSSTIQTATRGYLDSILALR